MKKIAIITDSASNLSLETVKGIPNLFMVPLTVIVDGKNYRDQIEISAQECYSKIDTHEITTSLPSMGDLTEILEKIKKQGFTDVLVINISSGLSGTFNAFRLALDTVEDINVTQYDSRTLGAGLGYLVEYALELVKANKSVKEIVKNLDELRYKDSLALYTISTLKYLRRGGRIGKVEGTIGDILKIKPVITVTDEGVYTTLSKSIGLQRALKSMKVLLIAKFGNDLVDVTIHYGDDKDRAEKLGLSLKKELNIRKLEIVELTPVLGVHTGPMMFGYLAKRVV